MDARANKKFVTALKAVSLTAALVLAAPAFAQTGKPAKQTDVRIATGTPGGAYYVMGAVLADELRRSGLFASATAEASSGALESVRLMRNGEITLSGMDANWVKAAINGVAPFKEKLEVRTVVPMGAWALFFIGLDNSPIRNVMDLKGKRIAVGAKGSGMEQHARVVLGTLGITFKDFTPVYLAFGPGAAAVREGKADVQLQCCIPNAGLTQLTENSQARVIGITREQIAKIASGEGVYADGVLRKGALKNHNEDAPVLSILNGWIGMASLPEETAYSIAKVFAANLDAIAKKAPQYASVRQEMYARIAAQGAGAIETGAPLHPGALRAFREAGVLK